jgi:hypothetical protein
MIVTNILIDFNTFFYTQSVIKNTSTAAVFTYSFCETNSGCRRTGGSRRWVTSGMRGRADMGI